MTKNQILLAELIAAKLGYPGPMEDFLAMLQLFLDAGEPVPAYREQSVVIPPQMIQTTDPDAPAASQPPEDTPEAEEPSAQNAFYAPAAAIVEEEQPPIPDPAPETMSDLLPERRLLLSENTGTIKGFVHLRCSCCGTVRTFCAKHPMSEYICPCCGGHTQLSCVTKMRQICECGTKSVYYTNITDWAFDIPCVNCQTPVAVEYHPGTDRYETIGKSGKPGKKRRK